MQLQCNETIQTFWWISSKRPPKINNDNHKRLSPAWWIVPYTVICEEVVNSIFVFLCVFYLNQVERTCSQIEFTSSDRGSEYFDMLICEVEYFHSLYCNKLLLNNKYLYSAFHHFDRHSSEFYSSRTIYIGLKLWFTNEIIWYFNYIIVLIILRFFMTFVFPNVMLSSSMFLAYVIYRLYFSEIYKEVYLNVIMNTCMYHVRERGFVRLLVFLN